MKKFHYCSVVLAAFLFLGQLAYSQTHFTGKFSAAQQSLEVTAAATGTASCFLTDAGLWFYITVEGLSGGITAAHIHNAPMGEDGPPVRTISTEFSGNTATGVWASGDAQPLTDAMVQELLAGNLYLNIHTAANGAGEIRAQINHSAGAGLQANLTSAQQTLDVTSDATGTASLVVTDAGVAFKITVEGLSGPITAAHLHNAAAGQDGPPVRTITDDFTGNTAVGLWTTSDGQALTDALIADLLCGNIYVNIHTAANGAGEIRGQVNANSGWALTANLDADQQTLTVTSDAKGTATMTLTPAGLAFKVTMDGLSGPIAAAHFHNAAAGSDGPVVRTISDDLNGTNGAGLWTANDAQPLTTELIQEVLNGNIYYNIHTVANAPGEIRGQVLLSPGTNLSASLTPAQLTGVTSSGNGTAFFSLTSAGAAFSITADSLSGPITAAHIHNAAMGTSGGPVRTLSGDFTGNSASGVWTSSDAEPLTSELIADLLAGNLYVNIHTAANGAGEIRGQIMVSSGTDLTACLTPAQQSLAVTSTASGTAAATLTDAGFQFHVTVDGLSGAIAAAHIHNGAAGSDGPPVRTISGDFTGNTASGLWTENDGQPLTQELRDALLAGNLYLNIHTANNGAGEIRGQLLVNGGIGITSRLDAAQHTQSVTSDAMGTSALTLTNEGLIFDLTVEGLSGTIAAAHWHNAPAGQDGPVARTLTDDITGNTGFGVWRSGDAQPLTVAMTNAVLGGEIYYNIHTATNPAGEIRGQVNPQDVITSVQLLDDTNIPDEFALTQNYPNPFNPSTTIKFSLQANSHAVLKIYNALGQNVATLVDENLQAGTYNVTFNAATFPSGIYFYELNTGKSNLVRKMILMK